MLHCPATLHLLAPAAPDRVHALALALRSQRIAMVWSGPGAASRDCARGLAVELDVPLRIDPDLAGLDVAHFGRGESVGGDCTGALDGIADLHRGEHVVVVGEVPAGPDEAGAGVLEIGDDGWFLHGRVRSTAFGHG